MKTIRECIGLIFSAAAWLMGALLTTITIAVWGCVQVHVVVVLLALPPGSGSGGTSLTPSLITRYSRRLRTAALRTIGAQVESLTIPSSTPLRSVMLDVTLESKILGDLCVGFENTLMRATDIGTFSELITSIIPSWRQRGLELFALLTQNIAKRALLFEGLKAVGAGPWVTLANIFQKPSKKNSLKESKKAGGGEYLV